MKITVLGATGGTGKSLVEQALTEGYQVNAILRTPDKLSPHILSNPNFTYSTANIFNADELNISLKGSDAVMSCLGLSGIMAHFQTVTLYSEATKCIVMAMKQQKIRRLICMSSWYTVDSNDYPTIMNWIVKPLILKRILFDMSGMEDYLHTVTDIDYTIVRPPGLSNQPITDKKILQVENESWIPGAAGMIPRANVAQFMLKCFHDQYYTRKTVAIGVEKQVL